MFFYNWREMVAWVAIFGVAMAIIVTGVRNTGDSGILRVAIGPKDSFQHQAGEALKKLLERRTPYQITLIHTEDSLAAHQALLDKKADLALLAPVALPTGQQWVAVAPLASLFTHVLVDSKSKNNTLYQFKSDEISTGNAGSDSFSLGLSLLETLELIPAQEMRLEDAAADSASPALLMTDHFSANTWKPLLQDGRYQLLPLREAAALSMRQPLWVSATIPAYIHAFNARQLPELAINTVATPLLIVSLDDTPATLITEISSVMQSNEGIALASRFDATATTQAWQLLPKHAAIGGDAIPVREQLREELAWWLQHKTLVLLLLAGVGLLVLQTRNLGKSREKAQEEAIKEQIEKMLDQLLAMEQRARTDHDLRSLYQLVEEVNHLKLQGSKLMLGTSLMHDALMTNFQLLCQHVSSLLEKRLQGKPALAAVA